MCQWFKYCNNRLYLTGYNRLLVAVRLHRRQKRSSIAYCIRRLRDTCCEGGGCTARDFYVAMSC